MVLHRLVQLDRHSFIKNWRYYLSAVDEMQGEVHTVERRSFLAVVWCLLLEAYYRPQDASHHEKKYISDGKVYEQSPDCLSWAFSTSNILMF
jgi:hypothetical protein